jgi:hypothetical protein
MILPPVAFTFTMSPSAKPTAERAALGMVWPLCWTYTIDMGLKFNFRKPEIRASEGRIAPRWRCQARLS